jgi:hypothetical protein
MFGIDDLIGGAVGAVSSVVGGIGGYKAQKKAINQAMSTQRESLEALEPWQQAGEEALQGWREKVSAGPGEFAESDEYKFALSEGEKAIKRGASTGAGFGTGSMGKSLTRYAINTANTFYDRFQDRYLKSLQPYSQLAGVGQWAVGSQNQIRNSIADLQYDKGIAKGNAWATGANAVRGGIQDAVSLSQLGQSGISGGGTPIGGGIPSNMSSFNAGYDPSRLALGGRL